MDFIKSYTDIFQVGLESEGQWHWKKASRRAKACPAPPFGKQMMSFQGRSEKVGALGRGSPRTARLWEWGKH